MKKIYKALVRDKVDNKMEFIQFEANSKRDFIEIMDRNGCNVYYNLVEEAEIFDWIMDNTNADNHGWAKYREMAKEALK